MLVTVDCTVYSITSTTSANTTTSTSPTISSTITSATAAINILTDLFLTSDPAVTSKRFHEVKHKRGNVTNHGTFCILSHAILFS